MNSPVTSNGRGLVNGRIYKRDGTLAGASSGLGSTRSRSRGLTDLSWRPCCFLNGSTVVCVRTLPASRTPSSQSLTLQSTTVDPGRRRPRRALSVQSSSLFNVPPCFCQSVSVYRAGGEGSVVLSHGQPDPVPARVRARHSASGAFSHCAASLAPCGLRHLACSVLDDLQRMGSSSVLCLA